MLLLHDEGLIIITDIFDGTPGNIAQALAKQYHVPLPTLPGKAISDGQQGVMPHTNEDNECNKAAKF